MNELEIYLDLEFDSISQVNGYVQGVIAFGACCRYQGEIKTFYSLVRPKGFKKLSKKVKEITHLENEAIKKAPGFQAVSLKFFNWLDSLKQDYVLYSFGPDDRRTLLEDCQLHQVVDDIYDGIENIQGLLTDSIIYKEKKLEDNLSLEALKKCYQIQGDTMHHALQDAIDLMLVHEAYKQQKTIDHEYVESLMKDREEHLKKRAMQTKENEIRKMKQRFANYSMIYREIFMGKQLLKTFYEWLKLEGLKNCDEDGIVLHDEKMLYSKLIIEMCVDINQYEPQIYVRFHRYGYEDVVYAFTLNEKNAQLVEELLKNV